MEYGRHMAAIWPPNMALIRLAVTAVQSPGWTSNGVRRCLSSSELLQCIGFEAELDAWFCNVFINICRQQESIRKIRKSVQDS